MEDVVNIYYSHLFTDKNKQSTIRSIFNFAHKFDQIPQLDRQLGTVCLFQSEIRDEQQQLTDKELNLLHLRPPYPNFYFRSRTFGLPEIFRKVVF